MPSSDSGTDVYFIKLTVHTNPQVVSRVCQTLDNRQETQCASCKKCLCVREEENMTLPLAEGRGLFSGVCPDHMTACFQF